MSEPQSTTPLPQGNVEGPSRIQAEQMLRGWNLLYNRAVSYGYEHPLVQDFVPKVHELFTAAMGLTRTGALNVLLQEAMFYVETIDVMYQPNNRRVADHLRRFGIEALTFQPGFATADFGVLLDACTLIHSDAGAFLQYLGHRGVTHIEINKVSLRAVREGDQILGKGDNKPGKVLGASVFPGMSESDGRFEGLVFRTLMGRLTAQEIEGNVALVQLLQDPSEAGRAVAEVARTAAPGLEGVAVEKILTNVLGHYSSQAARDEYSIEELLAGLYAMRGEMMSLLRSRQSMETELATDDPTRMVDPVLARTVSDILLDEFRRTPGNLRRLAHVLSRVVPGKQELRTLMPALKKRLQDGGMSLQQWFSLVQELHVVMQADHASEQLATAAAEFGASAEEVLSELRRDPRGAAQILLTSAEIRRTRGDEGAESWVQGLLDGLDGVGDKLADQAAQQPGNVRGMMRMLTGLRGEVERQVESTQLQDTQREALRRKVDLRIRRAMGDLKARALAAQLRANDLSDDEKAGALMEMVADEKELDGLLELALAQAGSDQVVQVVAQKVVQKVRQKFAEERERQASRDLPPGVYVRAVAEFFLRYEIRRAQRYGVPFAALLVSFQGLPIHDALDQHGASLRGLVNVLASDLRRELREVDFVGMLGYNRLLVVLPMTVEENAELVARKLRERLGRQVALPDGGRTWVRPRCGVQAFHKDDTPELRDIFQRLLAKWQEDT